MAFSLAVITSSGSTLPYAGAAPHPHLIFLKRLRYSEHFRGKFFFCGAKKLESFSFFFHNMLGLKSVSFKLVSLFLRRVALLFMHNLTSHNLLVRIFPFFTRVQSFRVLKRSFLGTTTLGTFISSSRFENFLDKQPGLSSTNVHEH